MMHLIISFFAISASCGLLPKTDFNDSRALEAQFANLCVYLTQYSLVKGQVRNCKRLRTCYQRANKLGLQVDDGLLKEIIVSYNRRVPDADRVIDFKDIQAPPTTYPVASDSRMNLTAVKMDGKRYKTSLWLTEVPESGFKRELSLRTGIFETCYNVYNQVIPKLEELLVDAGDNSELLWPIPLASRPQQLLITLTYPNGRWSQGGTNSVSTAADYGLLLRSVAKWHAMTAVLLERNAIPFEPFSTSMTVRNQKRTLPYYKALLKNFAEAVRSQWGDEWASLIPRINDFLPTATQKVLDVFDRSRANESRFEVLNIGDFFLEGHLFCFGISDTNESPRPIAVKFSSFERAHVNTPALDLNAVLYTLPSTATALQQRKSLLTDEYYPALRRYLVRFGFQGAPPTWAQLEADVKRTELFGVLEGLSAFAFSADLTKTEVVDDVAKSWKTGEVRVNMTGMLRKEFSDVMKPVMRRVVDENIL